MADLFLIKSDQPAALQATCVDGRRRLAELAPENAIEQRDGKGWVLLTSRNPHAPWAATSDAHGAAVVLGSCLAPGPVVSDLREPERNRRIEASRRFCRQLNFGVAATIHEGEVVLATDFLGLYPLYYYSGESVVMAASVPGLMQCHPAFRAAPDLVGIVGILLLAHGVLGRTIFEGVRRLGPGELLICAANGRVTRESVPLGQGAAAPRTLDAAVEAFDGALGAAVGSAVRGGCRSIMLSGGLDSRILAGYLARERPAELSAATFGERQDFEMRAAAHVARAVGAKHEAVAVDQGDYVDFARRELESDAVSSGFYLLNSWSFCKKSRPPVLMGLLGDAVMGATHVPWGREPAADLHTFHAMFSRVSAWGLSPGVIRELVRTANIDEIMVELYRTLRDLHDSYPGETWQRAWWFDLQHRQRFLVGRMAKVTATKSWPVLPYTTTGMLQIAAATPLAFLADRAAQIHLIRRKFPALARLPLLAANLDTRWIYLAGRQPRRWTRPLDRLKEEAVSQLRKRLNSPDRRFFSRAFDFDGVGWRGLRDLARRSAPEIDRWLNEEISLKLIPPPATSATVAQPVMEDSGRRTLAGLILACRRNFADAAKSR